MYVQGSRWTLQATQMNGDFVSSQIHMLYIGLHIVVHLQRHIKRICAVVIMRNFIVMITFVEKNID